MKVVFLLWERHLAAMIVAGSHSHKADTSLPIGRRQRATTRLLRTHQFQETGSGARHIRLPLRAADPRSRERSGRLLHPGARRRV
jgi:hypothetical protein